MARAGQSGSGVGSWFQGTHGALWLNADDRFTATYSLGGITHTDTITVRVTGINEDVVRNAGYVDGNVTLDDGDSCGGLSQMFVMNTPTV